MESQSTSPAKSTRPITGLSEEEVKKRLSQGLGNRSTIPTSRTYGQIFKENVFTFVNIVLFALGTTLVLLGRVSDALVSVGVIAVNVIVSVIQEIKAKHVLDHIALISRSSATVIREGERKKVDIENVVAGDILVLEPGDHVVVDGTVIGEDEVQIDESLLTGESEAITKHPGDSIYSGSFCMGGNACYQAEKVGSESLSNRLMVSARAFRRVLTPLQKEVNLIVRILLLVAIYLEVILVVNSTLEKVPLVDSIRMSVVILGLVPNGLFLAITTAYTLGAVRIAQKGALIQQSNAIESLSHVDVLCLDKTGTLTTNKLKVENLMAFNTTTETLCRTLGDFAASFPSINRTASAIAEAYPGTSHSVLESVPFSSDYRWSGLVFDEPDRSGIYILGAPETILPLLQLPAGQSLPVKEWTRNGLRVLLFAYSPQVVSLRGENNQPKLPPKLVLWGAIALADELRPEAKTTIENFRKAGVELKLISGDNPDTVAALAGQAGFDLSGGSISGDELLGLDPEQLKQQVMSRSIFGRVAPEQKDQIIQLLRSQGKYVAMIGDGVNDVKALKRADLAISLKSGSQAARAVADIVLLEDSFAVLPDVVQEGQQILTGMQDVFKLFLTRILYILLLIISTEASGGLPLTPKHNSIVSLLIVGIPTLALVAWAKPGKVSRTSIGQKIIHFILSPGLTLGLAGLGVFVGFYLVPEILTGVFSLKNGIEFDASGMGLSTAQSALTTFYVLCGLLLILFAEPPSRLFVGVNKLSGDKRPAYLVTILLLVYGCILAVPIFSKFFELTPLVWWNYLLLIGLAALWGLLVRWFWRKRLLGRYLGIEAGNE
jgi:cation-transporting ATPase E